MKKVGDLFAELGFRENGSESVKRAFIENLVKAAGPTARRRIQPSAKIMPSRPVPGREDQLSFDFTDEPELPFPFEPKKSAG